MSDIVIHRAIGSRSFAAVWMLEELGVPYGSVMRDVRAGGNKAPDYLAINPHGVVPTLVDGGVVVRESPAICLYLGDKYGYGGLSPKIEDPLRGPYLTWLVYATAVLEPARGTQGAEIPQKPGNWGVGWPPLPQVVEAIEAQLERGPWLLGERFTGADVMLGATLAMGLFTGEIPRTPALGAYNDRLNTRPACTRAQELTWPPEVFPRG